MKWCHLPVAGGIYDQHPLLIEHFEILFEAQNKERKRQMDKHEADMKRQSRHPQRRH